MRLSRRGFFQISGVTLAATQLASFAPLAALVSGQPLPGRVLEPVSFGGQALWPDSVVMIHDADATRYRLDAGWVPQSFIQPMTVDRSRFDGVWPTGLCIAEVSAPVAVVYRSADAASAMVARIGHAGVLTVRETLPDISGKVRWLAVSDGAGRPLGWTQAAHWLPADDPQPTVSVDTIRIDVARQTLTASENGAVLLVSAISTNPTSRFAPRESVLIAWQPHVDQFGDDLPLGTPWAMSLQSRQVMAGAHWHNRFGTPQLGPAIQLPPAVAKWLYTTAIPDVKLQIG